MSGSLMLRYLGRVGLGLCYPVRVARRRPKTALALGLVAVLAAGGAFHGYARYQWRAAQTALRENRPEEARNRLAFCLSYWPRDPDVHLLMARAARWTGDWDTAESHLNRCLALQNGATEAVQIEFLLLRVQRGEMDTVTPLLLQYVEQEHPESPLILKTLARASMHRLRYSPAYAYLTRWIELAPDDAEPYHWRGWVFERLNQSQSAMQDYLKALQLAPDLFLVRLRVAEMYLEDKKVLEAEPHLDLLLKQVPDRPEVQARLGQCRFLQGQPEEARRLLEAAVEKLPEDPQLLLYLGRLDLQEGRPAQAEQWLRRVLQVDSTDTEAHYTLSQALQAQGRRDEALATLKRYEEYKELLEAINHRLQDEAKAPKGGPVIPTELGTLFLRLGREQKALDWLELALQRDPWHQPALKALAEYYESKGQPDRAAPYRARLREPAATSPGPRTADGRRP